MNAEQVKELATNELVDALSACGVEGMFQVVAGGELNSEEDESFSFEYEIIFRFGNLKRNHSLHIGWNDEDGVGIEYGEDGDIDKITYGRVMASLYFDMAMDGLDDEYII